jgi:STE24 endopeptidase
MSQTIFIVIISILLAEYLISRVLDYLNAQWRGKILPAELQGIYDEEKYKKSQAYGKTNSKFALISGTFQLILILFMLFLGGFAYFDGIAKEISNHPVWSALIFFGILFFLSDIINLPFSLYATFVIEEKFGFNKTSAKTFILDKLKGWLLTIIIGGGLLGLIIWLYFQTTDMFWIYAWAAISVFSIFMSMFYSNLIVPLFNKQSPLEEGELRDAISEFGKKAGFKIDNIYVIDGSKRSSKANAYFTGLGKKKRIVLYDTLINDLSVEEIVAVLAHEIGHYKLKHTLTSMVLSIVQTGVIFYILSLFIGNSDLSMALGADGYSFELSLIAFGMLFSPISTVIGLFMNTFSRKNEYQADSYANSYGLGASLISSLKKLSVNNLTNLTPHPAYVFAYYSHPTLYQRIVAINKNARKRD